MKLAQKNSMIPLILVISLCLLGLLGLTEQSLAADPMELELNIGNSVGSDPYKQMKLFANKLEELSGGSIKVQMYPGGVLFGDKEALDAIMTDTVDFCFLNSSTASAVIKDLRYLAVPGSYRYKNPNDTESLISFVDAVSDIVGDIYADYSVKWLTFRPPAEAAIICSEKQITSPEDLEGMVFRISGGWLGKLLNKWGLATSTLPIADVTTALGRGTVKGTLTGSEQVCTWKFYEVAPNVTLMPETDMVGSLVMSQVTWNNMTKEQQGWVEEAAQYYLEKGVELKTQFYKKNMKILEDGGANVYQLNQAENEAFMKHIDTIHEEMKEGCTEKGIELLETIREWRKANLDMQ